MAKINSRSLFWWVAGVVVVLDFITKQLAVAQLSSGSPVYLVGHWLSLRLVHNPGAAFGINVGPHSRWVFMILAIIALVVLGVMVRQTLPAQRFRLVTLGMVCGGAVGNLIDRIRSSDGVVDFIDVWIGTFHWPTFNVADMAVSCGAIALASVLWSEGRRDKATAGEPANPAEAST
ncbi:MAG: signal peptidase II [Gemmatimonadota bacterium]|nr:MAG: signal peptidase II [Gemmatimonadota bacterium]